MPSTVVYVFYVTDVYERETSTRSIDRSIDDDSTEPSQKSATCESVLGLD